MKSNRRALSGRATLVVCGWQLALAGCTLDFAFPCNTDKDCEEDEYCAALNCQARPVADVSLPVVIADGIQGNISLAASPSGVGIAYVAEELSESGLGVGNQVRFMTVDSSCTPTSAPIKIETSSNDGIERPDGQGVPQQSFAPHVVWAGDRYTVVWSWNDGGIGVRSFDGDGQAASQVYALGSGTDPRAANVRSALLVSYRVNSQWRVHRVADESANKWLETTPDEDCDFLRIAQPRDGSDNDEAIVVKSRDGGFDFVTIDSELDQLASLELPEASGLSDDRFFASQLSDDRLVIGSIDQAGLWYRVVAPNTLATSDRTTVTPETRFREIASAPSPDGVGVALTTFDSGFGEQGSLQFMAIDEHGRVSLQPRTVYPDAGYSDLAMAWAGDGFVLVGTASESLHCIVIAERGH